MSGYKDQDRQEGGGAMTDTEKRDIGKKDEGKRSTEKRAAGQRDAGKKMTESIHARRSGIQIMGRLIGLVRPLLPVMFMAVLLGVLGYLCAIFLTIIAGYELIHELLVLAGMDIAAEAGILFGAAKPGSFFVLLVVLAVLRGILHYGEQYCNHFIAFKLLAIIRHRVFAVLRRLCPAKLETQDKGNLISILTSDIELLEVFYAHTISPIAIAALVSLIMVVFTGHFSLWAGALAAAGYLAVGCVLPLVYGGRGAARGMEFRTAFGEMNSFILDSLRGLDETIQYQNGEERLGKIKSRSQDLGDMQKDLNRLEASQKSVTNLVILLFSFGMLFLMTGLYLRESVDFQAVLISVTAMMGSFGPVVALAGLSNNLNQTLASAERVLSLLEEKPQVEEVSQKELVVFHGASAEHVSFSYQEEQILKDYSLQIQKNQVVGIHGASGSGKSTLLKLFMRFWDVQEGRVAVSQKDVKQINTGNLREMQSYVTQETYLFHDSIANNIAVGKPGAGQEEIAQAAKKASIHDFIMTLPHGYHTQVGELGDTLSGGEKQRIGIARAFLHDAPFLLLDEPTSNLDSLNEGIILKSLKESCDRRTVVLVSHRTSTMSLADVVCEMDGGRIS